MTLDADGKIVITGDVVTFGQNAHYECGVARLNNNGSADTSFNLTGTAVTAQPQHCFGMTVKAQSDRKIVVGGYVTTQTGPSQFQIDWIAIRYNTDGSADTSFGQAGAVRFAPPGQLIQGPRALLIRPNGKVILGGNVLVSGPDMAFIGFNADGTLDSGFGSGGVAVLFSAPWPESLTAAELRPDGKIVAMGNRMSDIALARVNENGSLDTSFGTNGSAVLPMAVYGVTFLNNLLLQPDGKILIGGAVSVPGGMGFAVMRLGSNGSVDSAPPLSPFGRKESVLQAFWGINGVSAAGFDGVNEYIASMALDAAGRVIVTGDSHAQPRYFALARFQGDNSPYASVSGTVRTAGGLPIRNAYVTLSGGSLSSPVTVLTNNLGIYLFTDLPVTETYTVTATAKRFRFATGERAVMLNADTENFDFTANQ